MNETYKFDWENIYEQGVQLAVWKIREQIRIILTTYQKRHLGKSIKTCHLSSLYGSTGYLEIFGNL